MLEGATITAAEIVDPRLTRPVEPGLVADALVGEQIASVDRRGKYLLVRLESGRTLVVHLRMTGSLRHAPAGELPDDAHRRATLQLDTGTEVAYRDVRRFGTWELLDEGHLRPYLATRLGPEPLVQSFSASRLARLAAGRRAPIKAFLLDQRRIAGIGNIYADEALWRARIHPRRPAGELDEAELARLHRAVRAALRKGVELQGSTLREYTTPTGRRAGCSASSTCTDGRASRATAAAGRSSGPSSAGAAPGSARTASSRTRLKHVPVRSYTRDVAATTITEAVVLRSFAFGEADRVLHVYTAASGRQGAVAKGVRRTKSRFGGRLEPFSHVELGLHRGRGELSTVTGASLVRSHDRIRSDGYRLQVGLVGLEAMLKLYTEEEQNDRAFLALTRFLDALDDREAQRGKRPALDPLVLSFQLKLLWLSGFLPHLGSCVECGSGDELVAFLPSAGGAVCAACDRGGIGALTRRGAEPCSSSSARPIADALALEIGDRAARDVLAVVTSSYEHHGGFRLRTLSA